MKNRPTENADEELLCELTRTAETGVEAMCVVVPKAENPELRGQLERQEDAYRRLSVKTEDLMQEKGLPLKHRSPLQKAMIRGGINMNTMVDRSTSHLAELTLNGVTMGIVSVTKSLHSLPHADGRARQLAEDFLSEEQKAVERLKPFL